MKRYYIVFILAVPLIFGGCSKSVLKQAFNGKLPVNEGNKVAYEYCQSCRVHRNLSPDDHVINISKKYPSESFKRAKECRTCHYIKENFWGDVTRKTQYPYMVGDKGG